MSLNPVQELVRRAHSPAPWDFNTNLKSMPILTWSTTGIDRDALWDLTIARGSIDAARGLSCADSVLVNESVLAPTKSVDTEGKIGTELLEYDPCLWNFGVASGRKSSNVSECIACWRSGEPPLAGDGCCKARDRLLLHRCWGGFPDRVAFSISFWKAFSASSCSLYAWMSEGTDMAVQSWGWEGWEGVRVRLSINISTLLVYQVYGASCHNLHHVSATYLFQPHTLLQLSWYLSKSSTVNGEGMTCLKDVKCTTKHDSCATRGAFQAPTHTKISIMWYLIFLKDYVTTTFLRCIF